MDDSLSWDVYGLFCFEDFQPRDTGYQSPSEVLAYIGCDLGAVGKQIGWKFIMIINFRHQNDHFDVPDGNRIESPSLTVVQMSDVWGGGYSSSLASY